MARINSNGKYLLLTGKESSIIDTLPMEERMSLLTLTADNSPAGVIEFEEKLELSMGTAYLQEKFFSNILILSARILAAKNGKSAVEIKAITTADTLDPKIVEKIKTILG